MIESHHISNGVFGAESDGIHTIYHNQRLISTNTYKYYQD